MTSVYNQLREGSRQLGIDLSDVQLNSMIAFLHLMLKWNKTHNLTAITQLSDMVVKHLLDSLSVANFVNRSPVLDVGCGAGLPSIPLAIACPDIQFTALDVSQKRIGFIKQFVRQSGIKNLQAVCSRVEEFESTPYSLIYSRAFSSLRQFTESSRHLLATDGQWHAMKGLDPTEEKAELAEGIKLRSEHSLVVPGLEAERRLLVLESSI